MSDDVLSIIPTDPTWQPTEAAADRAIAILEGLAPGAGDLDVEIEADFYDKITPVDPADNLARIGCPRCGRDIDLDWWHDLVETAVDEEDGFDTLDVVVPCCESTVSLNDLDYDWPAGFASFEIAVWNPDRGQLTDAELAAVAAALGHPVRQVMAHI